MAVATEPRYTTLASMWERINVDTGRDAASMTSALLASEIAIDTYCGRSFEVFQTADTDARYFRARTGRFCRIDDAVDISTVEVGTGTQAGTFSTFGGEYVEWLCNGGAVDMLEADSSSWPCPSGWVKVTPATSWGWSQVPGNVAEAARIQALKIYKRRDAPEGVLGFEGAGVTKIGRGLDPDVRSLLAGWVRREKANP